MGEENKLCATFYDANGKLADPDTVKFIYRVGDTTTTLTYGVDAITRSSLGRYHYLFLASTPGLYQCRWEGSGGVNAVGQFSFRVEPAVP